MKNSSIPDKEPPTHPFSAPGEPAYYLAAADGPAPEKSAGEAFSDHGAPLAYKLQLIFSVLSFDQRHRVLEGLGFKPVGQYFDEVSGHWLKLHKFYGFHEGGGIAGDTSGYDTREAAIAAIEADSHGTAIGKTPADLSMYAIAVMSAQEFLDELKLRGINDYGRMA